VPTRCDATADRAVATTRPNGRMPDSAPRAPRPASGRAPIAIVALGDALMGDDAFGPSTLSVLASHWRWPDTVELVEAGTRDQDVAAMMLGRRRVVLLDAVQSDAQPGTVVSWQREALIEARGAPGMRLVPCEPAIREAVASLEAAGELPEDVLLVGVVPFSTMVGATMSPLVDVACRIAAIEVVRRAKGWGADVRPAQADTRKAWWKAPA
jgi:hydrogenase maturation protease